MSEHSPNPVAGKESIARFVFSPLHITKNGKIKPSLFSHVDDQGCSVQRESIATDPEVSAFVRGFLEAASNREWLGVAFAFCRDIRLMPAPDRDKKRAVCLYDTAEPANPAHAEICRARHFEDADPLELRRELLRLFGDGQIVDRKAYRAGGVWNALSQGLRDRVATR
jgi:hypothetical protein